MKHCLVLIVICFVTGLNKASYANIPERVLLEVYSFPQQEPFYFLKPVPAKIKFLDKIDLSFFKNRIVVNQYRYRLEIPGEKEASINKDLMKWSAWITDDLEEILVPWLDQEGGYKFIIEYREPKSNEIKKFEKLFYVYKVNPVTNVVASKSSTATVTDKTATKITTATDKTATQTTPVADKTETKSVPATEKTGTKSPPLTEKVAVKTTPEVNKAATKTTIVADKTVTKTTPVTDGTALKTGTSTIPATDKIIKEGESKSNEKIGLKTPKEDMSEKNVPLTGNLSIETSAKSTINIDETSTVPDYNKLLTEAIEKKDAALFRKSVQNGAGSEIKGINGGNIFHIMDETVASEELISMLVNRGISINETDKYGNSPLHDAILSEKNEYARYLINNGADLDTLNNLELSPLHLATFMNNKEIANQLLIKGADINRKGNSGYTALHIASEMDYISLAKDLLFMGAASNIKTEQKLTPRAISKIQGNQEMYRLIGKKGSFTVTTAEPASYLRGINMNSVKPNPRFDFNLPYDIELMKKRQFQRVVQIISIPVFVLSAATSSYLKVEADNYYSLYKNAETEDKARYNYDKMKSYDTFTYISAGISLISVYSYIHSSVRKRSISRDMRKTYY